MKKLMVALMLASFTGAAGNLYAQEKQQYGEAFEIANVLTPGSFTAALKEKGELENVQLEGRISQVCQAKGCWIKLKSAEGDDIFVKFRDHEFFVPKDVAGRPAVVQGSATRKIISVAEQRHLAEDAGKSKAEIKKITTPKEEIRFDASGIIIM